MRANHSNFIELLKTRFLESGDAKALVFRGKSISFKKILNNIDTVSNNLKSHGIEPGHVVILNADYCFNAVVALLALIEIKAIIIPILPKSFPKLEKSISKSSPEFIVKICQDGIVDIKKLRPAKIADPLIKRLKEDRVTGLVLFTSGSSGEPKGVVHNFDLLLEKFKNQRSALKTINFLVFDHWGGLNTLLYGLSNCALVVLPENRKPDYICSLISENQIELLPVTPSFLNLLIASQCWKKYDLSCLKVVTYGAEPMPQPTLKKIGAILPNVDFRQTYGLIELGVLQAKSRNNSSLWVKLGGEGYDLRVVDGILQIKANSAMLGYLGLPSPFTSDGYFVTGDMVEVDGEYFRILGRDSEIINVGGEKVFPSEVEAMLLECDNVKDVVVYGEHHPILGQIVCAKVATEAPEPLHSLRTRLKRSCKDCLESYKVPVKIYNFDREMYGSRLKKIRT